MENTGIEIPASVATWLEKMDSVLVYLGELDRVRVSAERNGKAEIDVGLVEALCELREAAKNMVAAAVRAWGMGIRQDVVDAIMGLGDAVRKTTWLGLIRTSAREKDYVMVDVDDVRLMTALRKRALNCVTKVKWWAVENRQGDWVDEAMQKESGKGSYGSGEVRGE